MSGCLYVDACRGTDWTYNGHGCRGEACTEAHNAYQRQIAREKARPDVVAMPRRLPTGQVRTHLDELRAAGVGLSTIARHAGLDLRAVKRIASGQQKRITPKTKERLLAVMPSDLADHALVDAAPVHEALELLRGAGWSESELARRIRGPRAKQVDVGKRVRRSTAERVARLLADELGPDLTLVGDPIAEWRLLLADVGDREWRQDAECARLDGDVKVRQRPFFPTRGEVDVSAPRSICERCPVIEPCLDFALLANMQGIWAATTGDNRRDIRQLGLTAADVLAMRAGHPTRPLADLLAARIAERLAERAVDAPAA